MVDAQLNINLLDAVVFGVLFLSALISFFRGFIRELLSLLAWIGAGFLTLYLVVDVAEFLKPYAKNTAVSLIIATLGTYFLTLMTISLFSSIVLRYVKTNEDIGAFDNIMGLVFGVIKGSLIISLGFFLMAQVVGKEGYPEWVKTAYTLPAVERGAAILNAMLPSYIKEITTFSKEDKENEEGLDFDEPLPNEGEGATEGQGYNYDDLKQLEQLLNGGDEEEEEASE